MGRPAKQTVQVPSRRQPGSKNRRKKRRFWERLSAAWSRLTAQSPPGAARTMPSAVREATTASRRATAFTEDFPGKRRAGVSGWGAGCSP